MAGIIAHTVGTIAAAGAGDGTLIRVSIEEVNSSTNGFFRVAAGSVSPENFDGELIDGLQGFESPNTTAFNFILDGEVADNFFHRLEVEDASGNMVTFLESDANYDGSFTFQTTWSWTRADGFDNPWPDSEQGNTRDVIIHKEA